MAMVTKPKVFLSSALNGELQEERAALEARFGVDTKLGNIFSLWMFERIGAAPANAQDTYLRAVENSSIAIFLFSTELRDGVKDEFFAAERRAAVLCYVRRDVTRTAELDTFIREHVQPWHKFGTFSNPRELWELVEQDIQAWLFELLQTQNYPGSS